MKLLVVEKIALYLNNLLENKKGLILGIKFIHLILESKIEHPLNVLPNEINTSDVLITHLYDSIKNDIRLLIKLQNLLEEDKKLIERRYNVHMKNIEEIKKEISKKK